MKLDNTIFACQLFVSLSFILVSCATLNDVLQTDLSENLKVEQNVDLSHLQDIKDIHPTVDDSADAVVELLDVPVVLHHQDFITVSYSCPITDAYVGVYLVIVNELHVKSFSLVDFWVCSQKDLYGATQVWVHLPYEYRYVPDYVTTTYYIAEEAYFVAWTLDYQSSVLPSSANPNYILKLAQQHITYDIKIADPYERQKNSDGVCLGFVTLFVQRGLYQPVCPYEHVIYKAVEFPIVLSGLRTGAHHVLPDYHNPLLSQIQRKHMSHPRFTIVVWVYIVEYCPNARYHLCSIIQRINVEDHYLSPLVYINMRGELHLQMSSRERKSTAHLSRFIVPLHQWRRLVIAFEDNTWTVSSQNWTSVDTSTHRLGSSTAVWYNDTDGVHVFGGTEVNPSYKGLLAHATIYRTQALSHTQIPMINKDDVMFNITQSMMEKTADEYWVQGIISAANKSLRKAINKDTCRSIYHALYERYHTPQHKQATCSMRYHTSLTTDIQAMITSYVYHTLYTQTHVGPVDARNVGEFLYNITIIDVKHSIEHHIAEKALDKEYIQLITAAKFGFLPAGYMVNVLADTTLVHKPQQFEAMVLLMSSALHKDRLSLLALGHKHLHGSSIHVPQSDDLAYVYFKGVGDLTYVDREGLGPLGLLDNIKVNNDLVLRAVTDHGYYQYLKIQGDRGNTNAQVSLGHMFLSGMHGAPRDANAAAELFRQVADLDPAAKYNYAMMLMGGRGVKRDEKLALQYLKQLADEGDSNAQNVLGARALSTNATEAVEYFLDAYEGGSSDAAYNLAQLYHKGHVNITKDVTKAITYYTDAALQGHLSACGIIAKFFIRGHPLLSRSVNKAIGWSRYVGEANPAVRDLTKAAAESYGGGNRELSLYYYMVAALSGSELASFNLGYLCELFTQEFEGLFHEACVWKYFNASTSGRIQSHMDPYAVIRMGDYWYDGINYKHYQKAVTLYASVAHTEPQAVYNLAWAVYEGVNVDRSVISDVLFLRGNPQPSKQIDLVTRLLDRCSTMYKGEGYWPCQVTMIYVNLLTYMQENYYMYFAVCSVFVLVVLYLLVGLWLYFIHLTRRE